MHKNNIGTLRFLGAFFVLFGHTFALCYGRGHGEDFISEWLRSVLPYKMGLPGVGVAMFFVLSGYLVTKSYMLRGNFFEFAESRALRIYPALIAGLVLIVFVMGPIMTSLPVGEYFSKTGTKIYFLNNVTLFHPTAYRLPGVFTDNPFPGANGSLWTLPVEMRMYVIVAVLGLLGILKDRRVFNGVAIGLVMMYLAAPEEFFLLTKSSHERLGLFFLVGALFCLNFNEKTFTLKRLLALTPLMLLAYGTSMFTMVFTLWFAFLVMWISFSEKVKLPDLGAKGDFSYGLYLYAFPVQQMSIVYFGNNPWLILVISFIGTMFFAVLSWFLVEKPAMKLKGKIAPKLNQFFGITKSA